MFETIKKSIQPQGWPEPVWIHELKARDVLNMFEGGTVDRAKMRDTLCHLSAHTATGEKVFATIEAVGDVPARYMPGLMQIITEVMTLNMPPNAADVPT